jgi:hypothetical protein
VHSSLPRNDGSLAANEIAAMVGLSVGEVSDLLGTDAGASTGLSDAATARVSAAVHAIAAACTAGSAAPGGGAARGPALEGSLGELLAVVSAELRGAENALQSGVELLPALAEDIARSHGAAQVVRAAVQRTAGVSAAAQETERRVGHAT